MKPSRKHLVVAVLSTLAVANANATWPVIDAANLANTAKQVQAWAKQFEQMKSQIDQMKSQFDSMNGTRGIANLLNNPVLYDFLPHDFVAVLSADGSGGIGAASLMTTLKLFGIDQTAIDPASATGKLFQNTQNQNAVFRMLGEQGYKSMTNRLTQLALLTKSIDGATDPKAIADLQARISAEQGFIQNEQAKLQVIAQMQSAQEQIRQQQAREILMHSVSGTVPRF